MNTSNQIQSNVIYYSQSLKNLKKYAAELLTLNQRCVMATQPLPKTLSHFEAYARLAPEILKTFPFCWIEGCKNHGTLQRQNTAYHTDISNFEFLCDEHQEEAALHWQEQWTEYYSSVL